MQCNYIKIKNMFSDNFLNFYSKRGIYSHLYFIEHNFRLVTIFYCTVVLNLKIRLVINFVVITLYFQSFQHYIKFTRG